MARVIFPNGVCVDCAVSEVAGVVASGGQVDTDDKLREAVHLGLMDRDKNRRVMADRHAKAVAEIRADLVDGDKIYHWVRTAVAQGRDHVIIEARDLSPEAISEAASGVPGLRASVNRAGFKREVIITW
jgi:hypothetical protein